MIKIITFMENNLGLHTWMLHNFKSLGGKIAIREFLHSQC